MSKFAEVTMGTRGDIRGGQTAERAATINRGLAPFISALDWELWHKRPDGPFAKLAIDVVGGDPQSPSSGYKVGAVAVCRVATDLAAAERMSPESTRELGAALMLRAMEWVESTFAWTSDWLTNAIERCGRHRGPYRYEMSTLRVLDRRTGRSYVPFVEFGDEFTSVVVTRRERGGTTTRERQLAQSDRPRSLDYWFGPPRKARLIEDQIVFFNRKAAPIATISINDFDEGGAA